MQMFSSDWCPLIPLFEEITGNVDSRLLTEFSTNLLVLFNRLGFGI